jgi:hypothetical protein
VWGAPTPADCGKATATASRVAGFSNPCGRGGGLLAPPKPPTLYAYTVYTVRSSDHPCTDLLASTTVNSQLSLTRDLSIKTLMPQSSSAAHYMLYSILYLEPARTRHLLYLYAAVGVRTAVYLPCHGLAWRVGAQQSTHSTETRHRSKGSRGTIDRGHKELRRLRPCAALKSRAQLESRLVSQFTHTTGHVGSLSL